MPEGINRKLFKIKHLPGLFALSAVILSVLLVLLMLTNPGRTGDRHLMNYNKVL